ncbi:TauD/TfdA dioxygenase family protein [Halopseudomonas maritima]|uniref:TauD/TfdA dioxygenase family protein n=1 Tax=Halopseudomonas maritima TaxID=2918528 RepID=UPI001EEA3335|nr:TauD/TfdA family dioxygenase [Halopseudomonas maritima]UJJ30296.1 TauD/TfdA family dioxygenase [Halopseudomonas maritima]
MPEFFYTTAKNNQPRASEYFRSVPVAGSLGADIYGIDLNNLSDAGQAALRLALMDHGVLFIRDQNLSVEQLEAVTLRFGAFGKEPYVQPMADHPHVVHVLKEAGEGNPFVFGGAWHSDWSFQERPPAFTLLYGHDVPESGGDTLFNNMYLACEWLSPTLRALLQQLDGIHSPEFGYGPNARHNDGIENMNIHYGKAVDEDVRTHPLITRHPETGREVLFANPAYTLGIAGMKPEESRPLLDYLFSVAAAPAFTCRMRWTPGTLAIWDNRCVWHQPVSDYFGKRREMFRTTVVGEPPSRGETA